MPDLLPLLQMREYRRHAFDVAEDQFLLVSVVERHVLAILRRTEGDAPAKVTVGRIAHATGMSERRALFVLEGLEERRLLEIEPDALSEAAAVITESGRVALARAGGWPPRWP